MIREKLLNHCNLWFCFSILFMPHHRVQMLVWSPSDILSSTSRLLSLPLRPHNRPSPWKQQNMCTKQIYNYYYEFFIIHNKSEIKWMQWYCNFTYMFYMTYPTICYNRHGHKDFFYYYYSAIFIIHRNFSF